MTERVGEDLRECIVRAEAFASVPLDCRAVWYDLVAGNSKIVDAFFSTDRCYLVLTSAQAVPPAKERRTLDLRVLERLATGTPQKVVSADLGISASSVTTSASHYLNFLGICCRPSKIPVLLVMLACASATGRALRDARMSVVELDGKRFHGISSPRPELTTAHVLSKAQLEAVSLLIEGRPHAQIAEARRTSMRTVANQLASAYQRLGVSGRGELMRALALRSQAT